MLWLGTKLHSQRWKKKKGKSTLPQNTARCFERCNYCHAQMKQTLLWSTPIRAKFANIQTWLVFKYYTIPKPETLDLSRWLYRHNKHISFITDPSSIQDIYLIWTETTKYLDFFWLTKTSNPTRATGSPTQLKIRLASSFVERNERSKSLVNASNRSAEDHGFDLSSSFVRSFMHASSFTNACYVRAFTYSFIVSNFKPPCRQVQFNASIIETFFSIYAITLNMICCTTRFKRLIDIFH